MDLSESEFPSLCPNEAKKQPSGSKTICKLNSLLNLSAESEENAQFSAPKLANFGPKVDCETDSTSADEDIPVSPTAVDLEVV